jgi:hypothetical protein
MGRLLRLWYSHLARGTAGTWSGQGQQSANCSKFWRRTAFQEAFLKTGHVAASRRHGMIGAMRRY